MRKHRDIIPVQHIDSQTIAGLHQRIQILPTGVHLHPARMVIGRRGLETVDQAQFPGRVLAVRPDLVGLQVGRVEKGLGGIEDHAVDARGRFIFVVLHILGQTAIVLDGKHIAIARVLVEGIAIDVVRRLAGGQDEDSASVGVGAGGQFWIIVLASHFPIQVAQDEKRKTHHVRPPDATLDGRCRLDCARQSCSISSWPSRRWLFYRAMPG